MTTPAETHKRIDLLWQGRIHLGDEIGVYDDARYSGTCFDLPIQLFPFRGEIKEADITFLVVAEGMQEFNSYPGHRLAILARLENEGNPGHWLIKPLAESRMKANGEITAEISLRGRVPEYISLLVEVDTELPPGMYDEVVVRRVSMISKTHYGLTGFRRHTEVPLEVVKTW
jgi:hypothetical protein